MQPVFPPNDKKTQQMAQETLVESEASMDSWAYLLRAALEDETQLKDSALWTPELRNSFVTSDLSTPETKPFEAIVRQSTYMGIPSRPYTNFLARQLERWDEHSGFPYAKNPFPLLVERPTQPDRWAVLGKRVSALLAGPRTVDAVVTFLKQLDARDLLTLLGMRCTEGSQDVVPPSLNECVASFVLLNTDDSTPPPTNSKVKPSKLTVGARAFAKHSHRDASASWWGACSGSETAKNQLAADILAKILTDVAWMNVHQLPHNLATFEVRHKDGYGARWVFDLVQPPPLPGSIQFYNNVVFRGFLEPQMEGGHENAWRH